MATVTGERARSRLQGALARLASEGAAILVGRAASAVETAAARDLKDLLARMLQRPVGIVDDTTSEGRLPTSLTFVVGTRRTNRHVAEAVGRNHLSLPPSGQQRSVVHAAVVRGTCRLYLAGPDSVSSSYAVYDFLENRCGVGFFPDGMHVPKTLSLDPGDLDRESSPRCRHRIYAVHPWWTEPYAESCRLWGFEKWRALVDWMRRKRLNGLLAFHDEGGYLWGDAVLRAFPSVARSEDNLDGFVMLPEYRTSLNRRVFEYARANGIGIVYNLFYGQVPSFVRQAYPDLIYHEQNMDNLTVCASQAQCAELTERFWRVILETYGIDESHLYLVCPYLHERMVCSSFLDRAEPATQAFELLRSFDPQATVLMENWDWSWGDFQGIERAKTEWEALRTKTPSEVGVLDLGHRFNLMAGGAEAFGWYRPRPWIHMEMTTLEGAYPPSEAMLRAEDMIAVLDSAIAHDALGLVLFNIMTRGNELLSTLYAELPWETTGDVESMIRRYLLRRFGASSGPAMQESFTAYRRSIDPAVLMPGFCTVGFPPLDAAGASRPFAPVESGETQLGAWLKNTDRDPLWPQRRLQAFQPKQQLAREALRIAEEQTSALSDSQLYRAYLWELRYIAARWDGIVSLFSAHLDGQSRALGAQRFAEAEQAFQRVKDLYRGLPEYSMANLQTLEPEVQYNPRFLPHWRQYEKRARFWKDMIWRFHVVWERFDEYEAAIAELRPKS